MGREPRTQARRALVVHQRIKPGRPSKALMSCLAIIQRIINPVVLRLCVLTTAPTMTCGFVD